MNGREGYNGAEARQGRKEGLMNGGKSNARGNVRIHQLCAKYGNFTAVARAVGQSGSTVAKYIRMKGTPPIVKHTFEEVVRAV